MYGVLVIFLASKANIRYQILKYQPFRIVHRANWQEELHESVSSILTEIPDTFHNPYIIFECSHSLYRININQIQYIESQNKYISIVTDQEKLYIRYKLNDAEKLLHTHRFIRIHKSYLVNARRIARVNTKDVILGNGIRLPLSRYRAAQVREELHRM